MIVSRIKNIWALLCFCSLALIVGGSAWAADPFTVADIYVDARGATAIEAQTTAISNGQLEAAQSLIERLSLRSEREQKGVPPLTLDTAAKMIRALEIANEKRSGQRYLGDITVAFNPSAVQSYLRSNGLRMISTQARNRLVLPVLSGAPLWSENPWLEAWKSLRYSHALTPILPLIEDPDLSALITVNQAQRADKAALARIGQRYNVNQIVIAQAQTSAQGVTVNFADISLDTGLRRDFQPVTALDFNLAAQGMVDSLETDWKRASVTLAENAVSTPVTVLYRSHQEWIELQTVINNSAQIREARLDALSQDGALMTLSYGGDIERLRQELSFKGVTLKTMPSLGLALAKTGAI